jgi:hypothetical protein
VLLGASSEPKSREELQEAADMKHREHFRKAYIEPLVMADWLRRTIPDKPTSRLQKYLITGEGKAWLDEYQTQAVGSAPDAARTAIDRPSKGAPAGRRKGGGR